MTQIFQRIIRSGPNLLRFYVKDGWTKEEVERLVDRGTVILFDQGTDDAYFVACQGARFNRTRLAEACFGFRPSLPLGDGRPLGINDLLNFQ